MTNNWDDMRKAKEGSYFAKKDEEALERLANKKVEKPRMSPITGEPMTQTIVHGVVVDTCPTSGGVWLDQGELEQLMDIARKSGAADAGSFFSSFMGQLTGGKK